MPQLLPLGAGWQGARSSSWGSRGGRCVLGRAGVAAAVPGTRFSLQGWEAEPWHAEHLGVSLEWCDSPPDGSRAGALVGKHWELVGLTVPGSHV